MISNEIYTILGLCIGMAGILSAVIGAWINIKTKLASMEVKILELEKDIRKTDEDVKDHKTEVRIYMDKVDKKLGNIHEGINDIKVALVNKQDKK
jgi:hypothetical protein